MLCVRDTKYEQNEYFFFFTKCNVFFQRVYVHRKKYLEYVINEIFN